MWTCIFKHLVGFARSSPECSVTPNYCLLKVVLLHYYNVGDVTTSRTETSNTYD